MKIVFSIAVVLFLPAAASAASFNCAYAVTSMEKTICGDKELNYLDEALGENYKGLLAALGTDQKMHKSLRDEQRDWVTRRNKCSDVKCLKAIYLERLDETCDYGMPKGAHPTCTMSEEARVKLDELKSKGT